MVSPENQPLSLTSRSWEYYQAFSGLAPQDLGGKVILNLGSGYSDLAIDLGRLGISAQVFNLDINYGLRIVNGGSFSVPGNSVRADFNRPSIKENSADICFSSWAISLVRENYFLAAVGRGVELLKPGGVFFIYPLEKKEKRALRCFFRNRKEAQVVFFKPCDLSVGVVDYFSAQITRGCY